MVIWAEAIQRCHVEVVKLLAPWLNGQDLARAYGRCRGMPRPDPERHFGPDPRGVPRKALFDLNNEVQSPETTWQLLYVLRAKQLQSNVVHHNVAISAAEKACAWQRCLWLLDTLGDAQLAPSTVSFNIAISACSKASQWLRAALLLIALPKHSLQPDTVSLFSAMSRHSWQTALDLFLSTLAVRVQPDVETFNAGLAAANWQLVVQLLAHPPTRPDSVSFGTAGSAMRGAWRGALALGSAALRVLGELPWRRAMAHFFSHTEGQRNVFQVSGAVAAMKFRWRGAAALLHGSRDRGISQTVVSCGALLSACDGAWEFALLQLRWMPLHRLAVDAFGAARRIGAMRTWREAAAAFETSTLEVATGVVGKNLLLSALEKVWPRAMLVLRTGVRANVVSFNCALSGLEKAGYWRRALPLLDSLATVTISPDMVSCSAAISACEQQGKWRQAQQLLAREASASACAGAMSAAEKAAQWRPALQLLRRLPLLSFRRDLVAFNAALCAAQRGSRDGAWRAGLDLFKAMAQVRVEADIVSLNSACLCAGSCREGQVTLELLREAETGLRKAAGVLKGRQMA
ncbi:unnamed protein product [Effrenium voratum]|nr:unnamed protein product [Effrenium voratum]